MDDQTNVTGRLDVAGMASAVVVVLGLMALPASADAGQLQCDAQNSTFPPGTPTVTFFASHPVINLQSTWIKNNVKAVLGEHIHGGSCPTINSANQGPSCSPARSCASDQVCASGYRSWASCPGDAGPIEQDDKPDNRNWEDPEEGPSTFNDNLDTGEQGPCFCWDDSDPDQYVCSTHADCPENALCVDGKCRCRNFDWSTCDDLRFGLTSFDEHNCDSNTSEHTNHMVAEMEERQTDWQYQDVSEETNKLPGRDAYCTNYDYIPTDEALLEHQREEKFPTSNSRVTDRMWTRAHVTFLLIAKLPQTSNSTYDDRVKKSLDNVCKLLEGDDGGGPLSVPPIITYVMNDSNDSGSCDPTDDPIDTYAGMMAAGGGTGSCCYDANADGDCSDGNDLSFADIGSPGSFCSHVRNRTESTLRSRIDHSDTSDGNYICKHRTEPGQLGNAPFCDKPGGDCQLAGDDNEQGTNCGNMTLAGNADIMEDAMCIRTVPEGKSFSDMDYEICDSSGNDCRALTKSDVEFIDPNERLFRVKESAKQDADGDDTSCGNLQINPCPNEGKLCTTPGGCAGGVMKCFGDEEKCVPPNSADEVSCDGVDNDCDGFTDEGVATVGEAGMAEELRDDAWKSATYETSFSNTPIVLATTQTDADPQNPSQAHVRNTTTSGFETQHCEVQIDGSPTYCDSHGNETNGWFAIDPNVLDPYAGVQAGTYTSSEGAEVRDQIQFPETFEQPPLVFATAQTTNGSHVPRNVHAVDTSPTTATFEFCEQNYTDNCGWHTNETIGWLAVNPDANDLNAGVEIGTVQTYGNGWETVTFSDSFGEVPTVIADVQTDNGYHSALYAEVRNVTRTSADIRFCEYDGNDDCDSVHVYETVAWMAMDPQVTAGNAVKKSCHTGGDGRCAVGVWECVNGSLEACEQINRAVPEACNGLDDDCDGTVDNIETSWSQSWSVSTDDLSTRERSRVCSKENACTCADASDRDTEYRASKDSGNLDAEFDGMLSETVEENTDDDDGDGDVDRDDNFATRCSCSE